MQLEALSRGRPLVRELCRELRKEGNRRTAADVLDDPVVLRSSRDLLAAIRAIWRNADWPIKLAWAAFHVYVHLAFFFARVERMESAAPGRGFDPGAWPPPESGCIAPGRGPRNGGRFSRRG